MKITFKLATLFTESISDSKLGDLDTESIRNRSLINKCKLKRIKIILWRCLQHKSEFDSKIISFSYALNKQTSKASQTNKISNPFPILS
jgi:hypothetical protein